MTFEEYKRAIIETCKTDFRPVWESSDCLEEEIKDAESDWRSTYEDYKNDEEELVKTINGHAYCLMMCI